MKSYTDFEQSNKLAEILPIESADMFYHYSIGIERYYDNVPRVIQVNNHFAHFPKDIPCWSLAALLKVMPIWYDIHPTKCGVAIKCDYGKEVVAISDNPIDACYNMILKLNELNLL